MNSRQTIILEMVSEEKKMTIAELANRLQVSQVTIRKDLIGLENDGFIKRIHGYATINESDDINVRMIHNFEKKQRIARMVASHIKNGSTIMMESGSCCASIALELAQSKKEITIITNSAFIADYVRKYNNIQIILLGGDYQKEAQVTVGPLLTQCVQQYTCDYMFFGADGFSQSTGFTINHYMRAQAVKDMAKQANKICVVTDSSKFNQQAITGMIENEKLYAVFTDDGISFDNAQFFENIHVKVFKAL